MSPYSTRHTPLSSVKLDLDRIKRLSLAYQDETTWTPLASDENSVAALRSGLEQLVGDSLLAVQHEIVTPLGQRLVRDLDTSERMWEALKISPDRRTAREGFMVALRCLQEKTELLSVSLSDFTQFAKLARAYAIAGRGNSASSNFEVLGLRLLIEAGVFKATNDCLAVIHAGGSCFFPFFFQLKFINI